MAENKQKSIQMIEHLGFDPFFHSLGAHKRNIKFELSETFRFLSYDEYSTSLIYFS